MILSGMIVATGLSFLFVMLLLAPLERAFPARPQQRFFRPEWFTDLLFFLGQYLLWGGLVFLLWRIGRAVVERHSAPADARSGNSGAAGRE